MNNEQNLAKYLQSCMKMGKQPLKTPVEWARVLEGASIRRITQCCMQFCSAEFKYKVGVGLTRIVRQGPLESRKSAAIHALISQ